MRRRQRVRTGPTPTTSIGGLSTGEGSGGFSTKLALLIQLRLLLQQNRSFLPSPAAVRRRVQLCGTPVLSNRFISSSHGRFCAAAPNQLQLRTARGSAAERLQGVGCTRQTGNKQTAWREERKGQVDRNERETVTAPVSAWGSI
jgi:hypothetical protein